MNGSFQTLTLVHDQMAFFLFRSKPKHTEIAIFLFEGCVVVNVRTKRPKNILQQLYLFFRMITPANSS